MEINVRWYWTKECIGLRSCTDVVLKGLVPDLCIRGCVTCRIISGVKRSPQIYA